MLLYNPFSHRALAFAYDVELRLNPWYGRARTNLSEGSNFDVSSDAGAGAAARMGAIRRGGYRDINGGVSGGGGNGGDGEKMSVSPLTKMKEADLLACG